MCDKTNATVTASSKWKFRRDFGSFPVDNRLEQAPYSLPSLRDFIETLNL